MTLTRKNNALTNDVVSMYDAVGYGEVADQMVSQMISNIPQSTSAPTGGGGGNGGVVGDVVGLIIYGIGKLFGAW